MVQNSILRKNARAQLGGSIFSKKWLMVLVVYLIYTAIASAASSFSCGIASIIITGPLFYGMYRVCVNVVKGRDVAIEELFDGFKENFSQSFLLYLMTQIFVALWSLLFVIPGIVKSYSYAMAPYILQDDPTKDWKQCLDESKEMMNGNKWQLFCLDLSFIGWIFVGLLCCCVGVLFVIPYQMTAHANFYMALKAMNEPEPEAEPDPAAQEHQDQEYVDPFEN